jgi:hypothetical protein
MTMQIQSARFKTFLRPKTKIFEVKFYRRIAMVESKFSLPVEVNIFELSPLIAVYSTHAKFIVPMEMNQETYVKERLDDQISWYDLKSAWNKKWHLIFQISHLCLASMITISAIVNHNTYPYAKYVIALLGAIIAITSGVVGLYKFNEKWVLYRTTAESLKHEKYLFITKTYPYHSESAFTLLVGRVESLISKENSNWSQSMEHAEGGNESKQH